MSYILDALRKADAERDLGGVPSLHAQPVPMPEEERSRRSDDGEDGDERRRSRVPGWQWGAVVVAAAAVLLAGWALWSQSARPPAVAGNVAQSGSAPAPVMGSAPATALPPPAASQAPAAAPAPAPVPGPTTATATPKAPAVPATKPAQAAAAPARPAVSVAPPPAARPAARSDAEARAARNAATRSAVTDPVVVPSGTVTAAAPAPATRLPSFADLPPDVKRGLPALSVSGSVYSSDPASRMLIINGQLVREGDSLGPDTVLEKIQPKSAIVRVRDLRATLSW